MSKSGGEPQAGTSTPQAASPVPPSGPVAGEAQRYFEPEYINVLAAAHAGNLELSNMADSKASILLGASFVVFGLSISDIAAGQASVPLVVLTAFSFVATVLGVLTVRPARIRDWKVEPGKSNIMFFGSYTNVTREQFIDQCVETLASPEESIRVMARDIYDHGQLLKKDKFSWLYWSYTAFLWGMWITAVVVVGDLLFERF
ncbi:MAG TPA: Pycsar system effector family protein [Sphingomicrobium sp.]|nr:Pycsar system effector family protein [Sphingomicrobium sp.]